MARSTKRRPATKKAGAKKPGAKRTLARKPAGKRPAHPADALIAALPEPRRAEITRIDRFIRETVPALERGAAGALIGYGPFHYRYASGREGDTWKIALSSRAQYISLYTCAADARGHVAERYRERLPAADIGKGCVRFKRFDDLDPEAVRELLREAEATGYGV